MPRFSHNLCSNNMSQIMMRKLFVVLVVLIFSACSVPKPQPDSFVNAEQAIQLAEQVGAEQHSPVELRFAREKLEEAHKGVEYKQYDKTFYLIEQAEINADLAVEKTKAAIVRARVSELAKENAVLRQEFEDAYGEAFE
jgi:hypothetical protein